MSRCPSHPQSLISQEWIGDTQSVKPCIYGKQPDGTPDGCYLLAAAKPHNGYICMLLNTDPTRWKAFGADDGPKNYYVIYAMLTNVPADDVNDATKVIAT